MKNCLKKINIVMYSMRNEGKFVIAETIITVLKNKIYKHMTNVSKNVYIDVLDKNKTVDEYNNTKHSTMIMKPSEVKKNLLKIIMQNQSLNLLIMFEYQNARMSLLNDTLQIGRKRYLLLKRLNRRGKKRQ